MTLLQVKGTIVYEAALKKNSSQNPFSFNEVSLYLYSIWYWLCSNSKFFGITV
jgi:hypothetical protein